MHSRQLDCTAEGSTEENFTARQKVLMHSKQLQCTAESLTVQQEALSHSRKFCYIAKKVSPEVETGEKFLLRQKLEKSQSCGRNWRKVPSAAKTGKKTVLRQKLEKIQSAVETGDIVCAQAGPSWVAVGPVSTPLLRNTMAHHRRRQPSPLPQEAAQSYQKRPLH